MGYWFFAKSFGFEDNKYYSLDYRSQCLRRSYASGKLGSLIQNSKCIVIFLSSKKYKQMGNLRNLCCNLCQDKQATQNEKQSQIVHNSSSLQRPKREQQLVENIGKLQQDLERCQQTIGQKQQAISYLHLQLTNCKAENTRIKQEKMAIPYENADLKKKYQQELQQVKEDKKRLEDKCQKMMQQLEASKAAIAAHRLSEKSESQPGYLVHRSTKLFSGDVLDEFDDFKIYLTDILEKEMGMTIKRTQLLFRFEKVFPRNLHLPVDGNSPVVLLIKTVKGYHIACVSQAPFVPKSSRQGRGWLISLTKGRVYRSAAGKQAILYDGTYLIFGNQEIRIDGGSNKVFSNFGSSSSFYNTSGNDVRDFLGPGLDGSPREAEIESYEIFKLIVE